MKKELFILIISILLVETAGAQSFSFDIFLQGNNQYYAENFLNENGNITSWNSLAFSNYSAHFVNAKVGEYSQADSNLPFDATFNMQLLDSGGTILDSKEVRAYFYILSDPVTFLNYTSISAVFNYNPSATFIRVLYNGTIILEQEFRSLLCNSNNRCENEYTGDPGMFENYLSCPSDCDYFGQDGICSSVPGQYSFNDGACDRDCSHDIDENDPEAGECFKSGINQCHSMDNNIIENNQIYSDTCTDSSHLLQYRCGLPKYILFGSKVHQDIITCTNGCENSACLNATQNKTIPPVIIVNESGRIRELPPEPGKPARI